jgi:integrase
LGNAARAPLVDDLVPLRLEGRLVAIEKRASKRSRTGHVYRVRYPDPRRGGKWLSATFDNFSDAETYDANWRVEQRKGRLGMLDAGTELVGDYVREWLRAWSRSPGKGSATKARKTVREAGRHIDRYILQMEGYGDAADWGRDSIAWLQLRQVDARVVERWKWELEEADVGVESIRKTMGILQQVFARAITHRKYPYDANPVSAVPKPPAGERRQPAVFTPDVVEDIRARLLARYDRRSAYLVSTIAYSGARPGELLGAQRKHYKDGRLKVEQRNSLGEVIKGAKSTKRRRRSILLPKALVDDLDAWVAYKQLRPEDPLFPNTRGTYWTEFDYNNWRRRVYGPTARQTGLTEDADNPYDLRHVYISLRYAAGHSPIEVATAAGHAPSLSMDYYAGVIAEYEGKGSIDWEAEIAAARAKHAKTASGAPPGVNGSGPDKSHRTTAPKSPAKGRSDDG